MVINLSPSITNENETTSSLQFAERLKKVKLEVRSKTNPVQGKIMHLKQELEQERHKRTELEYKLQQHMKEKQPDISQVHGELNRYKDQNVKLEQTLDKLLLFSCKNMNGNQLQQEFVECEVLGKNLSASVQIVEFQRMISYTLLREKLLIKIMINSFPLPNKS